MTTTTENVISTFSSLLGEARVKTDEATRKNFALGNLLPECVVSPGAEEEVAAVLRRAAEADLAVVPCRNGTKLGIGNRPHRYDVALCLRQMNRIWHYEPKDLTVTVETGMKLSDFEYFVGKSGLWLPLDPPFESQASIGGVLASNSSGRSRLFYGQLRDMTLGMTIATADGKLIKTGGRVVKNVTGYDLSKLMIGSFGTLGVITQASFKLYPLPPVRRSFRVRVQELVQVHDFRRRLAVLPIAPLAMEFLDEKAAPLAWEGTSFGGADSGLEVWIEAGGVEAVVERSAKELAALASAVDAKIEEVDEERGKSAWSRLREFRSWLPESYPGAVLLKANLPIGDAEEFIARATSLMEAEFREDGPGRCAVFAHLGSGVVHFWGLEPLEGKVAWILRLRELAEQLHGSLRVELAPARIKAEVDVWGDVGESLRVMQRMKAAWDPKNTLSPGRFVGGI